MTSSTNFNELFLRRQKDIFAYVLTLVPDRNDAEDVYQQTCLALLQKQAEFDPGREFFPWACGFALNEVRRFRRAHGRERTHLDDAVIESLASVQFKSEGQMESQLALLMDCLAELSLEKRQVLMQSYSYHGGLKDLASRLCIEPDTLYKRLERIRKMLFECMQKGKR